MSHAVTVTRTTTTTTTSAILLNTGYFKTYPGLLKLAELIIGAVIVGLLAHYSRWSQYYYSQHADLFFLIVAVAFLIGTFCLLLSCILSISTASILPKTLYEVIYHSIAFILYLAASINFLVVVNDNKNRNTYEPFLAAAILGLVNTVLYLLSTALAYRSYKGKF